MAKKRIIPKLQLMKSNFENDLISLVTTEKFNKIVEVGDPTSQAKIYEAQLADELILIDIGRYKGRQNHGFLIDILRMVSKEVFLPLTIGGGVNSIEDIRTLLNNGADKVSINSSIVQNPQLLTDAVNAYGSSTIVVSIDYKPDKNGVNSIYTEGGLNKKSICPIDWSKEVENLGAGELLLTNIDHDGSSKGLDINTLKIICENSKIPVIISGGCGNASHFIQGFKECRADGIAAGTFFSFQDQNPMQTRGHIQNAGFNIRTST